MLLSHDGMNTSFKIIANSYFVKKIYSQLLSLFLTLIFMWEFFLKIQQWHKDKLLILTTMGCFTL